VDTLRKLILGVWLIACWPTVVLADPALDGLPTAQLVGQGLFSRFGFSIYEAKLWAPEGRYRANEAFALSLTYLRQIKGASLVQATVEEMEKLKAPIHERKDWVAELVQAFPNVQAGESITAVYRPGQGAEFFHRDQPTGRINDHLAQHFFAIWLDPRTSEPALRQALLGEKP